MEATACRAAWTYERLRGRHASALDAAGALPLETPPAQTDVCIDLNGDTRCAAALTLSVMAGAGHAADLRHEVEAAMVARHSELELAVRWQRDGDSTTVRWRCALVEWSVAMSVDRAAEKLIGLVVHCLSSEPGCIDCSDSPPRPSIPRALATAGPLAASLRQTARRATCRNQWAITVYQNVPPSDLWPANGGVHLVPPVDRFWADPFLARESDDRLWVFFEELAFDSPRGKIRCLSIDRHDNVGEPFDVLVEPCHLSYPNVFHHAGHWYMLPESSERGDLTLYRAREFPRLWEPVARLLEGVRLVDATLHRSGDAWWIMAASADSPGGSFDDTLHVYRATELHGPWVPSRCNPVRCDPSTSRPAGPLFRWNGIWVRPVQDCRGRYGRAMHLMAMSDLDERGPREVALASMTGDESAGVVCTHTYCRVGNDLAVDWLRWRSRLGGSARPPRIEFAPHVAVHAG